jgi:hypothetical protein
MRKAGGYLLKSGDIKRESESPIVAAQYQTTSKNYLKNLRVNTAYINNTKKTLNN